MSVGVAGRRGPAVSRRNAAPGWRTRGSCRGYWHPPTAPCATVRELVPRIERMRQERNAVILAHNYQLPEVQDIADIVGDSLNLSRQAAQTDADVIVFCGVHFMAETAAILSPQKT